MTPELQSQHKFLHLNLLMIDLLQVIGKKKEYIESS